MHAIDFGAGGISGIGPLTTRNLNGCGVCIIVVKAAMGLDSTTCTKSLFWWQVNKQVEFSSTARDNSEHTG